MAMQRSSLACQLVLLVGLGLNVLNVSGLALPPVGLHMNVLNVSEAALATQAANQSILTVEDQVACPGEKHLTCSQTKAACKLADRHDIWHVPVDSVLDMKEVPGLPHVAARHTTNWTNRLLVWPEQKFAFCWIDKNGGTEFNLLMNRLNQKQGDSNWYRKHPWWGSGWWTYDHLESAQITHENGWHLGIFLRDPAERLLSAWMSKCQVKEEKHNCLGHPVPSGTSEEETVQSFEDMVRNILPTYDRVRKELGGSFNSHYDPQHTFCGGRGLEAYDYIARIDGNVTHTHDKVVRMLREVAHVPKVSPFWEYVDQVFPKSEVEGHSTSARSRMKSFYRNQSVLDSVKRAFATDYELLGFK